jgi:hypothetical protein
LRIRFHFDRLEHHDMAWLQKERPNDVRQVENSSRITREVMPALFTEVREQIAAQKVAVPFVVHIGDLMEGLAGHPNWPETLPGHGRVRRIGKTRRPIPVL